MWSPWWRPTRSKGTLSPTCQRRPTTENARGPCLRVQLLGATDCVTSGSFTERSHGIPLHFCEGFFCVFDLPHQADGGGGKWGGTAESGSDVCAMCFLSGAVSGRECRQRNGKILAFGHLVAFLSLFWKSKWRDLLCSPCP